MYYIFIILIKLFYTFFAINLFQTVFYFHSLCFFFQNKISLSLIVYV